MTVMFPAESTPAYKVYVGPGNNSLLIKTILKQRWWFSLVDSKEND
jgi:hypothetical protein